MRQFRFVFAAAIMVVAFVLGWFVIPPPFLAIATDCTSKCGPDTSFCAGSSYNNCDGCEDTDGNGNCASFDKKTYHDPLTRSSELGTGKVDFNSVDCWTTWTCGANPLAFAMHSWCTPPCQQIYSDAGALLSYGDTCRTCVLGTSTTQIYQTCFAVSCN